MTRAALFERNAIRGGLVLSVIVAIAGPLITVAFAKAPNPGFANIVTRLSTVWLYLYCLAVGKPTHVNPKNLALIVLGAILLIYGTQIAGF